MPEQDFEAAEVNHPEKVFDVVLPARHQPAENVQPREQALHPPTLRVAAKLAPILCLLPFATAVRCNQFDVVLFPEFLVERV
jgi:hypothetical protein